MRRFLTGLRRTVVAVLAATVITALAPVPSAAAVTPSSLYPVRPGTKAWAALDTHADKVRVTQLPHPVVEAMPTGSLASAALDYPLLPDALAFNNVQHGLEIVIARSNVLTELMHRPDAGTALLGRYAHLRIGPGSTATSTRAGYPILAAWKLESLLAQPQVLATLSDEQLEWALRIGRDKYAAKQANPAVYSHAGLEPTAVLLGRTLARRESWDWKHVPLLRDAITDSPGALAAVLPAVERHFAEPDADHPMSAGIGTMDRNTIVRTPRGTAVAVIEMSYELSISEILDFNNYVRGAFPNAVLEANASRRYNCHSYAWYSQQLPNHIWMNTPGDDKYWQDGSYAATTGSNAGLRWSWPASDDHSAIGAGSGHVRSKWGMFGRYLHWYHDSPYEDGHGQIVKYRRT